MGKWSMYRRRGSSVDGPSGVKILAAYTGEDYEVIYTFGALITVGIFFWEGLTCGGLEPVAVVEGGGAGDNYVGLEYSQLISEGDPWALVTQIPGLSFAGGLLLSVPQSGTIQVE